MSKKKRIRKSAGMTSGLTGDVTFGPKKKISKSKASGTVTFGKPKKTVV